MSTRKIKSRLGFALILALLLLSFSSLRLHADEENTLQSDLESHGTSVGTTFCKWGFPWPRTVYYYVSSSIGWPNFIQGGGPSFADRISYGGNTWNGWNFNLSFQKTTSTSVARNGHPTLVSQHYLGNTANNVVASVSISPPSNCNLDQGNPIVQSVMKWDPDYYFYTDCKATGTAWCQSQGYYDIHNVSSHEFGHWFHLGHSGDNNHASNSETTMYPTFALGEWKKRDLTADDIYAAYIMYGYR